tara:strand:+ start:3884 stop:4096 length:213 start_codon:yes stop_codon:yes gene_type:complete
MKPEYKPIVSASGKILRAYERYSRNKVALMISQIESAEEWNDGVLRIVMNSSATHYINGQISDIFKGIKK